MSTAQVCWGGAAYVQQQGRWFGYITEITQQVKIGLG